MSKVIWCIGLYASASTWVFNVVRLLHAQAQPPLPIKTYFLSGAADFAPFAAPVSHIVKTHELNVMTTEDELARRAEKIIITLRDPRDAITSLMLYHHKEFEHALKHVDDTIRLCIRHGGHPRARVFYYESRFFENPETVSAIAGHLGIAVPPGASQKIFGALKREEVEKHISKLGRLPGMLVDPLSGDRLDPQTHWHTHHSGRDGEIGRWKHRLTMEQVRETQNRLRDVYKFNVEK